MGYKDQDKQRERSKERVRRYREKQKALQSDGKNVTPVTPGGDNVTPLVTLVTPLVTPSEPILRILGKIAEIERRLSDIEKILERVSNLEDVIEGLKATPQLASHRSRSDVKDDLPFSKFRQTGGELNGQALSPQIPIPSNSTDRGKCGEVPV